MTPAPYFQIFVVSAIVMGLSHTVAKERIFAALRARFGGPDTFFGYLVSCPYCASHWLALLLVPLTRTYVVETRAELGPAAGLLDWFLSAIFITVSAAFLRIAFYFVDERQGLLRREIIKTEAEAKVAQYEARISEMVRESQPSGRPSSPSAE